MHNSVNVAKILCELIDDCQTRMQLVKEFLQDVEPNLEYDVIQIDDIYGPTKTEPSFEVNFAT